MNALSFIRPEAPVAGRGAQRLSCHALCRTTPQDRGYRMGFGNGDSREGVDAELKRCWGVLIVADLRIPRNGPSARQASNRNHCATMRKNLPLDTLTCTSSSEISFVAMKPVCTVAQPFVSLRFVVLSTMYTSPGSESHTR